MATAYLAKQSGVFSLLSCDFNADVSYEFTDDVKLLDQYYDIRQTCFRRDLGIADFDGSHEQHDTHAKVLIARHGDRCIGGIRISGSDMDGGQGIPLEHEGMNLRKLFPELMLQANRYCQWGRLALLPEYRGMERIQRMCAELISRCIALGYRYAFNVTGLNRARLYQRLHSVLGFQYQICIDKPVSAQDSFAALEHLISVSYFDPNNVYQQQAVAMDANRSIGKVLTPDKERRLLKVA